MTTVLLLCGEEPEIVSFSIAVMVFHSFNDDGFEPAMVCRRKTMDGPSVQWWGPTDGREMN